MSSIAAGGYPLACRLMILERSMNSDYLSNTYLVASGPGAEAFFVDAGGPVAPLLEKAAELSRILERFPSAEVLIHPEERPMVPAANRDLRPGDELEIGGLVVQALHT